jgi:hypothetical protein
MTPKVITTAATACLVLALATGCVTGPAGSTPEPSAPGPTATGTGTPSTGDASGTPTAQPTESGPIALPVDCTDIVDRATYAATFGDIPLNPVEFGGSGTSSGVVTPSEPPTGAGTVEIIGAANELSCLWRDPRSDVSGISVAMGHLDPAVSGPALDALASAGYTCTAVHEGRSCQLVLPDPQYPVDRTQTYWARDDVVVTVDQTNVPTDDLLGSIATRLWG